MKTPGHGQNPNQTNVPGATQAQNPQVQALLEQLAPIEAPIPVGWWPLAAGWYLVIAIAVALVTSVIVTIVHKHQQKRYRRSALKEIDQIEQMQLSDQAFVYHINDLLKRIALYAFAHERCLCSKLHGQQWVDYLNQKCKLDVFDGHASDSLCGAHYRPNIQINRSHLLVSAKRWVNQHSAKTNSNPSKLSKVRTPDVPAQSTTTSEVSHAAV